MGSGLGWPQSCLLPAGERRWKITDVVGAEDGLGVECLSGSGAIASVYAKAFRKGFTLTLVSGRTVGIGAYLARLGRRCALVRAVMSISEQSVHPIYGTGHCHGSSQSRPPCLDKDCGTRD